MAVDADPADTGLTVRNPGAPARGQDAASPADARSTVECIDDAEPTDDAEAAEGGAATDQPDGEAEQPVSDAPARLSKRSALIAALLVVAALAGLVGWLSFGAYESQQVEQQRRMYLKVGRQGALDLTTIDYTRVDADVARILDDSTGAFHDDFQQRAQPFIDVVRKAQSSSVGTVSEAGLESATGEEAQVLVAVQVKTSIAGAPEAQPRGWRMRINVQKIGDKVKISNVAFVP
jgi:Mce-associated membrane protein